ncbi:MAG: DUF2752 domain-containing protein [Frankiaceae bacterium]|nr:DUF2752 domain-containing protein [Frankiaceae bacterium]MBV9369939.1 DUF2752 domain-containing protein [Frankiales bacterium]
MAERRALIRVSAQGAALAAFIVVLAAVHVRRPATFCVLRATTGVPCPFCGGTTAAVDLGHGRFAAAMAASPLALVLLASAPALGVVRAPEWWWRHRRRCLAIVLVVLAIAEVWQLKRFGLIGH